MSAKLKFDLPKGISIGKDRHKACEIRALDGLEYLECLAGAEKLIMVPRGITKDGDPVLEPELVSSPAMMSLAVLKASVVRIGEFTVPIDDEIWKMLDKDDINTLVRKCDEFDLALQAVAIRGRSDPASEDASLDS